MLSRGCSRAAAQLLRARPAPTALRSAARFPRHFSEHAARCQQVFHSQMEDPSAAAVLSSLKTGSAVPQTLTEKIVQRHCVGLPEGKLVRSGDYVTIRPQHCMTHDNSWPVALKFMSIGASKILDDRQIVMTLDHDVQNKSESNLKKYRQIEEFAKSQGVDFFPAGRGIGHQILVEEFFTPPGSLVVASDSHSNMYGGVSCLGTAVVRTDAAAIWATGKTWWRVPPIAKVTFRGALPQGVTGKDVIVALAGCFNRDEVLNHAIEFTGSEEALSSLSVDDRLTIANMTTEWGALTGLFEVDKTLQSWLRAKATDAAVYGSLSGSDSNIASRLGHARLDELFANPLKADRGAKYAKELFLDLSTLSPYVAGPNSVKVATPLKDLEAQDIKIDRAYLVSCTNSRASDLAAAAKVFKDAAKENGGKVPKIADGVKFYIAAASMPEQIAAEEAGDWQVMLEAGATALPSGCGPCIGLGVGLLEAGDVGISSSNRNFSGRMGSRDAQAYLSSPEIVAASALSGRISGPGWYTFPPGQNGLIHGEGDGIQEGDRMLAADEALDKIIGQLDNMIAEGEAEHGGPSSKTDISDRASVEILPGFPEKISGEIVFCDADNINTDGIYPGKLTYQDYVSPEDMAAACMSNYDPNFNSIARQGDILVSGFAFGVGSSREQAATAILAKGIPLVAAGSFSNIFGRNSINNALMNLEVPKLVSRLREVFGATAPASKQSDVKEPEGNSESLYSAEPGPPVPAEPTLSRRTGWTLTWDVRRAVVEIKEGENGKTWTEPVSELPSNVQEVIAQGGLEKWVQAEISKAG